VQAEVDIDVDASLPGRLVAAESSPLFNVSPLLLHLQAALRFLGAPVPFRALGMQTILQDNLRLCLIAKNMRKLFVKSTVAFSFICDKYCHIIG